MNLRALAAAGACTAVLLIAGGAPASAAAPSDQDVAFLKAAHQSNLAEIATGKQAQQKADSQQVKDLGSRFVTDHTRLDQALTRTAQTLGVDLPGAPNAEQQAAADKLAGLSGSAYDSNWISIQMDQHMKAMANGEKEISGGSDAAAKKVASDAAPVIASHHDLLNQAASDLGVPNRIDTGTGGQLADPTPKRMPALILLGVGLVLATAGGRLMLARRRSR